jgi:hypothetical protein
MVDAVLKFRSRVNPSVRGFAVPAYTLGEILSSATAAIGRRDDIPVSDASRLANDAYFEVWYATMPEEAEAIAVSSTTSGENKIELPSDFHAPISAALVYRPSWSTASSARSSYLTLTLRDAASFDGKSPEPVGVPAEIAFFNSWIELWPSPNSAYSFQLRYRRHPTDLTSLTSVPSLSTPWRKAVELKTREYLADFVGDEERSQKAQVQYLRYVSTLKTAQAVRQSGEFDQGFKAFVSKGGRRRV